MTARQAMKLCHFDTAATDPGMRIPNEEYASRSWMLFIKTGRFLDLDGAPFAAATKLRPVPADKLNSGTAT